MKVRKATLEDIKLTEDWGTWDKEPSEFPWHYDEKETYYILEGSATVTDDNGNQISFASGDWVEFMEGLSCTWKISKTIKKGFRLG